MKISENGLEKIAQHEGTRARAYRDVGGLWTIGVGHLIGNGSDIDYKNSIYFDRELTSKEVSELLKKDVERFEISVTQAIGNAKTNQNQFDAMVSLCFNIGEGNFSRSTVLRKHKAGDHFGAAAGFMLFNKVRINGVLTENKGLTRRRIEERKLYES